MRMSAALVLLLLLATACGGGDEGGPGGTEGAAPGPGATTTADPNALYQDFIPCEPLPTPTPFEPIEGLVMPEGTVVLEVNETGPLTSVTGLIDRTPVDIRDEFASREDVELIYLEDEGFEAEILLDSGDYRTFIKSTIRCRTGSVIALIVAPDQQGEALPVPGQQAGGAATPGPAAS